MSEFIQNGSGRINGLTDFARGILQGGNGKFLVEKYKPLTDTVTPEETMQVFDRLLNEGIPFEKAKAGVGKIVNIFYRSLKARSWEKPAGDHFLSLLMAENRGVEQIMLQLKPLAKAYFNAADTPKDGIAAQLRETIELLKPYELHYIKKENILFPYIESTYPQYRCIQLMWGFHDDFRKVIKNLTKILDGKNIESSSLNKELGKLFFVVLPVIFREEQILFPVAYKAIPANAWASMTAQATQTGWCFIEPPAITNAKTNDPKMKDGIIDLGTGKLSPEQLILMLENLPVDVTYVDENDEVRYFSGAKHRIFPRAEAIIGRKVQNCHPTDSVYMVNKILNAFRSGEKSHADFWIRMQNRFIHIRYFALRSETGEYRGTIEVSQDVTGIRALQGERRLLDWDE